MADISKITLPSNDEYNIKDATARSGLATKQDILVSGTNIKTINNESLLGSGNITIQGGGDSLPDQTGHSGDILTTNGTAASWMDVSEASSVSIDTSISSSSTDSTIPSSKAVWDAIDNIPLDDHKWAGVELGASGANVAIDSYVPSKDSMGNTSGTASWARVTSTPQNYCIAKYDGNKYLYSTTPSVNDSTTKVATTNFVQTAISNIDALPAQSSSTNGKVLTSVYDSQTSVASASWATVETLPSQTGNSGKYLTTNGTAASWGAASATSTKSIDSAPTSSSSNLVTSGGVYTAINNKVNRTTAVNAADTNYTTLMARGVVMLDGTTYDAVSDWSTYLVNGAIAWRYE